MKRFCAAALLTMLVAPGCSAGTPSPFAPTAAATTGTSQFSAPLARFRVLHQFGGADGANPSGGLINVNGTLYGTTAAGGKYGYGTVYSISTAGSEKVIYSFKAGADGSGPGNELIDVKGTLYGTTTEGGGSGCMGYGCGTVYGVTPAGSEKVLHAFKGGSDGVVPDTTLMYYKGLLYGTTEVGGTSKAGVVYTLSTTGSERVLYTFAYGSDGAYPDGALTNVRGLLYGTTAQGGSSDGGTVYSITTTGSENVLHSFGGRNGANPRSGLLDVNGTLYGTTSVGGSGRRGVVYSVTTSGKETVLHRFGPGTAHGWTPYAGVIYADGTFYGTTTQGGGKYLSGIVYSMSATGAEKVLHTFTGGSDGAHPSELLDVKGALYGTAAGGGSGCSGAGCGIIFSLAP